VGSFFFSHINLQGVKHCHDDDEMRERYGMMAGTSLSLSLSLSVSRLSEIILSQPPATTTLGVSTWYIDLLV